MHMQLRVDGGAPEIVLKTKIDKKHGVKRLVDNTGWKKAQASMYILAVSKNKELGSASESSMLHHVHLAALS